MPVFQPIYNSQRANPAANEKLGTASPNRGLTPACWLGIDITSRDPSSGLFYLDDFLRHPDPASYTLTQKGSVGAVKLLTEADGIFEIDSASGTADQGPNIQFNGQGFLPPTNGIVAFEARIRTDDIGTGAAGNGQNIAFGLANLDSSFFVNGAVDTAANGVTDYAMFLSISSAATWNAANKWSFQMTKAGSSGDVDTQKDIATLIDGDVTATGFLKLGFRAEVGRSLELFVNGVKVSSSDILPSIFPDTVVYPTFVIESEGSVDPMLNVDWYAFGYAN